MPTICLASHAFGHRRWAGESCPSAREVVIGPEESAPIGMCFMPMPETKTIKNRVHLDLTTGADDQDAEIERLLRLGARRVNIGQTGEESWTVLADPEGNEFCVVRPKSTLID